MKKIFFKTIAFMLFMTLFASCGGGKRKILGDGKTPLERYGALNVQGTQLCGQDGKPVQLCGMSSHGLHWYGKYANYDVIKWLRDDWNCDIWRAAMYTRGGYLGNKSVVSKVIDSIEAAKQLGIYVIVDWHILSDNDPLVNVDAAAEFFDMIASTYADCPNIIYEICNEPNGESVTWDGNIKPFAEQVIPVIRKYCDNLIIVGTPIWSSDLLSAAKNPIIGQKNIMYTYHFYAGTTGQDGRNVVSKAIKEGLPVFVTEWGTTQASGDGGVFEKDTLEWTRFMAKKKISWVNWSVNNKGEDSGVLKMNKDRNAKGGWKEEDLSKSGILVRKILRGEE
jgi:endoglucanase